MKSIEVLITELVSSKNHHMYNAGLTTPRLQDQILPTGGNFLLLEFFSLSVTMY